MKRQIFLLSILLLMVSQAVSAADYSRETYYARANGKKGQELKTALCGIINQHTTLSYDYLWTAYKTTDVTPDGYIWDMYSNTTRYVPGGSAQGKSYSKEGDSYNREHSVPQSWFGERSPMKTDLFHVIPTDGYVNNRRSNYDLGDVGSITYSSNNSFSKLGKPTSELKNAGCSEGTVFEPNDIYKGDFARIYFYMVTCYENQLSSWSGSGMLNQTKYPSFTNWARQMLLRWAQNDAVSQKETDRQEGVYSLQGNRNPFVDFPGLEQYVWGTWADSIFSVTAYRNPYEVGLGGGGNNDDGDDDDDDDGGGNGGGNIDPDIPNPVMGDYVLLTTEPESWPGVYLIAYHPENDATKVKLFDSSLVPLDAANNVIDVEAVDNVITSNASVDAVAFTISATDQPGSYAICGTNKLYVGRSESKNGLSTMDTYSASMANQLSIVGGNAVIKGAGGYQLMYNSAPSSGNRFRYYKSGQEPIYLYRKSAAADEDAIHGVQSDDVRDESLYDLSGRRVTSPISKGIYIRAGRKVVFR